MKLTRNLNNIPTPHIQSTASALIKLMEKDNGSFRSKEIEKLSIINKIAAGIIQNIGGKKAENIIANPSANRNRMFSPQYENRR